MEDSLFMQIGYTGNQLNEPVHNHLFTKQYAPLTFDHLLEISSVAIVHNNHDFASLVKRLAEFHNGRVLQFAVQFDLIHYLCSLLGPKATYASVAVKKAFYVVSGSAFSISQRGNCDGGLTYFFDCVRLTIVFALGQETGPKGAGSQLLNKFVVIHLGSNVLLQGGLYTSMYALKKNALRSILKFAFTVTLTRFDGSQFVPNAQSSGARPPALALGP